MRLRNNPEMTVLNTLVKASFKNTHSDQKVSVTPVEVTMNIVMSWKNNLMLGSIQKHATQVKYVRISGMNVIIFTLDAHVCARNNIVIQLLQSL
jgi:hypothetical protein